MNPVTIIKRSARAALRRRYAYAALRTLRRGLRRAFAAHRAAQLGQAPYSTPGRALHIAGTRAFLQLRKRFPNLDHNDPRATP